MQKLEIILQERNDNDSGLDDSLLFYSGSMAPLNFKPASASSNKLDFNSLLDYVSELLKPYGVSSSSIKPGLVDKEEIELACKAAKEWSKDFSVPSPAIPPKVEMFNDPFNKALSDYCSGLNKEFGVNSSSIKPGPIDFAYKAAKAWEGAIYNLNLSVPSLPLPPLNKPASLDWSPQNNVLSGFYSPSSPINPFKIKSNPYDEEKSPLGMSGFELPKPDFSWFKPAEPIMPDFNMHNPGWGAKQNIKTNASSWEQPSFEMPKPPRFEPLQFKMPEMPRLEPPKLGVKSLFEPEIQIEPYKRGMQLEGEITLKGSRNTAILKEHLGEGFFNIYSHHERGYGRAELNLKPFGRKGIKIFDYTDKKW